MLYLKLGIRNLAKHRRKTTLTLLTVSLGFACLLLAKGYSNYCLWGLRESIINGGVGHYQIFRKGYKERKDDDSYAYLISDYKKAIRELSTVPGVKFVAPRLSFTGLLSSGDRSAAVVGYGGWHEEERALLAFSTIEKGEFPRKDDAYGLLIGGGVSELSGSGVGDDATISVAMPSGAINAMDFRVSGVVRNQLEEMENTFAFIPLETAQALLNVQSAVDSVVIILKDTSMVDSVEGRIREVCDRNGFEYRKWDQIVPYYQGASEFYSSSMNVALVVILAIVVFSIINTMLMTVYDRMREIGTMRSIGTTSTQIMRMLNAESVMLGFGGCLFGLLVALAVALVVNSLGGIPLPPPPGNTRAYKGLIYIERWDVILYSAMFVAVSSLSSLFPAMKARKLSIADTLRWI